MRTARFSILAVLTALIAPLAAQDGQQLYTLYCSACHGVDGEGATGGAFPPLAGSAWIEGNPKRSVAIVLKGIHGPIEVNGKAYNLEMPPQEAVLGNRQISAILKYVHTAWGNKGEKVAGDLVKVTRDEFKDRKKPWTAPEILELFPLPKKETALKNLISRVYKGQWNQLPDFSKIEAENIEEEHDGILSTTVSGMKDNFGIVWEGDFMAPADGDYVFLLDADDGARLILAETTVAEVVGKGAMDGKRASEGKITLSKGVNPIRVEYFDAGGDEGIDLGWKKAGQKQWKWLSDQSGKPQQAWPDIPLSPFDGKTVIYRNFISGTSPRAIGFGFPGGVNLAYSADRLAPELVWSGNFIDAGRHWTNRGTGSQPPSSDKVITLTKTRALPKEAKFKGYSLDDSGNPTFKIAIGPALLDDSWKAGETGTLVRTLTLTGGSDSLEIPLGNAEVAGSESVTVKPGEPATVTYQLK